MNTKHIKRSLEDRIISVLIAIFMIDYRIFRDGAIIPSPNYTMFKEIVEFFVKLSHC